MLERFVREARYTAAVEHPNVTRVYGSGEADGVHYLALEYVEGTDLSALLTAEHRLEPRRALELLAQVAHALDAAHARGILHRDVKPGNILIAPATASRPGDRAVLTDLGLSKEPGADASALTVPGDFVGTTQYTAPEQILGRRADHRADVYSLGCVLYECLVGDPPFPGPVDQEVLYGHLQEPPPRPSERRDGLPAALDEVIARALAKDPEARFGSCSDLIASAWAAIVSPVLRLRVTFGNAAGTEIEVGDELVIGRHADDEGRLANDAEISRMHARISRDASGRYVIADLGSTNGTFVNGRRIDGDEPLSAGDVVELGATTLVVDAVAAEPPAPPEPETAAGAGETVLATTPPMVRPVAETMLADTPLPVPSAAPPAPAPPVPAPTAPPPAPAVPPPAAAPVAPPPPASPPVAPAPPTEEPVEEAPPPEPEPTPVPAAAETGAEVDEAAPAAAPPLSLRLEVDWEAREVSVGFGDEPARISLVHEDGQWRVAPTS